MTVRRGGWSKLLVCALIHHLGKTSWKMLKHALNECRFCVLFKYPVLGGDKPVDLRGLNQRFFVFRSCIQGLNTGGDAKTQVCRLSAYLAAPCYELPTRLFLIPQALFQGKL